MSAVLVMCIATAPPSLSWGALLIMLFLVAFLSLLLFPSSSLSSLSLTHTHTAAPLVGHLQIVPPQLIRLLLSLPPSLPRLARSIAPSTILLPRSPGDLLPPPCFII
jgi:hypothetical protein